MRVLLDEQIDWRLKRSFDPGHEVETVRERGWIGKRNGELLTAAAPLFDVLLTPAMPKVNWVLREVKPGRLYRVTA